MRSQANRSVTVVVVVLLGAASACSRWFASPDEGSSTDGVSSLSSWNSRLAVEVSYDTISYDTITSGTLVGKITAQNVGSDPLTGRYSGCAWTFRAYATPSREGTPLWRQGQEEGLRVCHLALLDLKIDPGDRLEFSEALGRSAYIVDGLTIDTLYLSVTLTLQEPGGTTSEMPAGTWPVAQ